MFEFEKIKQELKKVESVLKADSRAIYAFETEIELSRDEFIENQIQKICKDIDSSLSERVYQEFKGVGPLDSLMTDEDITEIMINSHDQIWFEKKGQIYKCTDSFLNSITYSNFLNRVLGESKQVVTLDNPQAQGVFKGFRLQYIDRSLSPDSVKICLRRHPESPWTFQKLLENKWCNQEELGLLSQLIKNKENFLVIGGTGTGKTSFLSACLQSLNINERVIIIEDTSELKAPNQISIKLLTREGSQSQLKDYKQSDLLKISLRLRPDRIVMGEIRGEEAKDFLLALATGHGGSFGSLHASHPLQALIRLEMLVQMGAPQWGLMAIRRLIQLSLQYIVVIERNNLGQRLFKGLYKISSLEETGFTLETCYSK